FSDPLYPERFLQITQRDVLRVVLAVLDAPFVAGFAPIKFNMVVMRGYNDDEVETFALLARTRPLVVRFIEFMPLDNGNVWNERLVVPAREINERIASVAPLEPLEPDPI